LATRRREVFVSADVGYELRGEMTELLLAVLRLSPKQRAAIVLHCYSGSPCGRVAEMIRSRTQ
jgi:hypothetical protein